MNFFPIHIQHFTSDFNSKIITHEGLVRNFFPIHIQHSVNGYKGMCMSRGKFLKPWQVTHKISEWIFSQFTFNFTSDSNSENNNSQGFENSQMVLRGCVWAGKVS